MKIKYVPSLLGAASGLLGGAYGYLNALAPENTPAKIKVCTEFVKDLANSTCQIEGLRRACFDLFPLGNALVNGTKWGGVAIFTGGVIYCFPKIIKNLRSQELPLSEKITRVGEYVMMTAGSATLAWASSQLKDLTT